MLVHAALGPLSNASMPSTCVRRVNTQHVEEAGAGRTVNARMKGPSLTGVAARGERWGKYVNGWG
jgi:hypothetical protein